MFQYPEGKNICTWPGEPRLKKTSNNKLEDMDQARLARAPVNNPDAEGSVGFAKYELKQRAKELSTVSGTHII